MNSRAIAKGCSNQSWLKLGGFGYNQQLLSMFNMLILFLKIRLENVTK